jgi:hypothetical protein
MIVEWKYCGPKDGLYYLVYSSDGAVIRVADADSARAVVDHLNYYSRRIRVEMKTPREVIVNALSQLADDLGQFEQTTHGSTGPFNFIRLGDSLAAAYRKPDSYFVSDLSQMCRGILNELTEK